MNDYNQVRSLWGYDIFISPGKSNARGTAVLFNNNFEYKVNNEYKDQEGNLLVLELNIFNKYDLLLINIYGPNMDNPDFYRNISDIISNFNGDFVIAAGDFNLVQDTNLDYYNYNYINNKRARQVVLNMKDIHALTDPWRVHYENRRRYTWFRTNPLRKARLDFFLISDELLALVDKVNINAGYRSDHSRIELCLVFSKFEKRKGFWKFNNSLIKDNAYIDIVKNTIKKLKILYAASPYNPLMVDSIDCDQLQFTIDDQSFFEQLLLCIRGETIRYSSTKKRKQEKNTKLLEEEINHLETLRNSQDSPELLEKLRIAQNKLQEIRNEYIKGLFVRTKVKWIEHGEKPTKYFLSLEKRNYINKTINKLVHDSGCSITTQSDILLEIEKFYMKLYSSYDNNLHNVALESIVNKENVNILSSDMSNKLEGIITREEALSALKLMKNDKSPGPDGFTTEFYKFFWRDIGCFLVRSLNFGFHNGQLSITQRQGVISIIPKKDKPREYLKNWRPISLLNVSYKIASASIANRIKTVLDYLIHENQKGFLKGRFIGENSRMIYDVLQYAHEHKTPGMILLIDFEKAFDSISWRFLFNALKFFNFGSDIIKWISVLYNNAKLCVIQNGIFSQFFEIGRGCRQGDPVSPYIFNLCVEIMGHMIRQNSNIKGMKIGKEKICLLQYADDTVLFLDGSEKSLKSALDLLFQFSKYSGLKPNISKTKAIWIGSKTNSTDTLNNDFGLQWTVEPFSILGVIYTADLHNIEQLNFDDRLSNIQKEITHWSKRNITPIGKITVIKSLLLSKITHLLLSLPRPNALWIKELEKSFFKFIWGGKNDKIARKTLQLDFKRGGCRMIDLDTFIKSLKLTWIRRLLIQSSAWSNLFCEITHCDISHLFQFGADYSRQKALNTSNAFWKETLLYFAEFINTVQNKNLHDFLLEPLWYNDKIKIQNKAIYNKKMYDSGFHVISDILDKDGRFLKFEHICNELLVKIPFTFYEGLKRAIMKSWPDIKNPIIDHPLKPYQSITIRILIQDKKGSRAVYDYFNNSTDFKPKCESKWESDLNLSPTFNWQNAYKSIMFTTKDTGLIWFTYRILHRILGTNNYLHKIKIVDNKACSLCSQDPETILHLFFHCPFVTNIWSCLSSWIFQKTRKRLQFDIQTVIFGLMTPHDKIINLIIMLVKRCIFSFSRKNLPFTFNNILASLKSYFSYEKKMLSSDVFLKRWAKWKCLFE
jgi:exonuclease III